MKIKLQIQIKLRETEVSLDIRDVSEDMFVEVVSLQKSFTGGHYSFADKHSMYCI